MPGEARAYRAWMFRIVRNAAIDEVRRKQRVVAVEAAEVAVDLWNFDAARIAKITVGQALATLDPAHREIVALIDIAGFSYAEAAEMLGVPAGTVMSRLARARAALLAAIESSTVRPMTSSQMKSNHGH